MAVFRGLLLWTVGRQVASLASLRQSYDVVPIIQHSQVLYLVNEREMLLRLIKDYYCRAITLNAVIDKKFFSEAVQMRVKVKTRFSAREFLHLAIGSYRCYTVAQ